MLVTSGIEASPIEITQAVKNGQTGKCVAEVIEQAQSMRIIDRGFISSATVSYTHLTLPTKRIV